MKGTGKRTVEREKEGSMKQTGCIFVDDGSPEAVDYDTNFVGYDASSASSYEGAILEVNRRWRTRAIPASSIGPVFRLESESSTRAGPDGTPAGGLKQSSLSVCRNRFLNGWAQLVAMAQRSFRINKRRAGRRALLPTDRFLRRSRDGFTFP